ncbi:OLC1v1001339C2 [Oldenlandia corymbosa var. corymbosa]|uniref:Carboxypeptidase n=1 Tax=Oldenlandia corymbosa var. corymbosa TaxID=529605 RepID=A0AAV1D8H9_OLDCO|nr:OLC1v1001339C2 [Oldenlandia corymbosa var. corymbosa]
MEMKLARFLLLLLPLFILFSSLIDQSYGKLHRETHSQFLKAKFNPNSNIENSLFEKLHDYQPTCDDDQKGLKEKDRISKLPGQPPVRFNQYGGYVTVDESAGRAFFYYFTEAQDPQKAKDLPLLLWLNGGPGCSSLSYGAFQELGPFRVGSDGKTLFENRFAWNKAANVLFLESPAGVGFSYSNTTSDYTIGGDIKTAQDNYIFLINWLERFPEYKGRDFYLAGESYAGHYVPQLAHNIVYHNNKANKTIINLKGILVGNGVINDETDSVGMYDYWASHALISPETLKEIHTHCDFSKGDNLSTECQSITDEADQLFREIDVYSLYSPRCFSDNLTTIPKPFSIMNIDPCSEYYVYAYFNLPEVQKALHANITNIPYDWEPCSDVLANWTDSASTVLPILRELTENGIRVWKFSGDVDGRVPVTGTQYSLEKLNFPIQSPWSAWYLSGEVGGFVQYYKDNLTFVTVRGAGHQVPSYRPDRSLSLVSHFLSNTLLPYH